MTTSSEREQRILKRSIGITVAVASSGILLGLLSGSLSIVFDGLFSVIDTVILTLALAVARLVQREGNRQFQHGYWHIEPMVLGRVHKIMLRVRDCWLSSTARGVEHGSFVLPYGQAI